MAHAIPEKSAAFQCTPLLVLVAHSLAPCHPSSLVQGESEELLLDSVIKEGHMSLIQQ